LNRSTLREFTYDPNESQRREAKRNVLKSETEQLTVFILFYLLAKYALEKCFGAL